MSKHKLYVGNLDYEVTSKDLIMLFTEYGEVAEAMVIPSKNEGKSKGFAFVSFDDEGAAKSAIDGLNGKDYKGRQLIVRKALDRQQTK